MGWWRNAYEGQEVVCINAGVVNHDPRNWFVRKLFPPISPLTKGKVYVVAEIRANSEVKSGVQFLLTTPSDLYGRACWFSAALFSPVQTKSTETGMAILKRILERPHQRIEEEA